MLSAQAVLMFCVLWMDKSSPPSMALVHFFQFIAEQLIPAVREVVDHRGHVHIPDYRIRTIGSQTEAFIAFFQAVSDSLDQLHVE